MNESPYLTQSVEKSNILLLLLEQKVRKNFALERFALQKATKKDSA